MGVNKVQYGNQVLLDISDATVTPAHIMTAARLLPHPEKLKLPVRQEQPGKTVPLPSCNGLPFMAIIVP